MGLRLKTFNEVLNDMSQWVTTSCPKLNNFYVGSVIRSLMEAIAVEVESLYYQMMKSYKFSIENSIFHSFDFYRFPATASSGSLLIKFRTPAVYPFFISAGTRFSTVPSYGTTLYFESTQDFYSEVGATSMIINIECTEVGTSGNVPANCIKILNSPIGFVEDVSNPDAFYNGQEEESVDSRKKRFTDYIATLARGTTAALKYGCTKVSGVTGAYVDDGIGIVKIYVHDASGDLPNALKAEVITSLLDYRSAGIEVVVLPAVKRLVDVDITIKLSDGYDATRYCNAVKEAVVSFLNYYTVSQNLNISDLITFVMTFDENAIKKRSFEHSV